MDAADRELAKLLVERSYLEGDFVLSSGRRSRFYFDCRRTTCFAPAMSLIGAAFLRELRRAGPQPRSVGGPPRAADPVASAISHHSASEGRPMDMFLVRKERKEHGTGGWIEGCPQSPVALVDDAVTSGGSLLQAVERCREAGLEIAHVAVLVDREEGGLEAIRSAVPEVPVTAIFTRTELDALRESERGR